MKRCLEYVQFQGISRMSKIIQKWTRDNDSHSAVLDRERAGTDQLIEQWPHKGGIKSWMDYNEFGPAGGHTQGTPYQIWSLTVDESDYDLIMGQYRKSADGKKPYDWSGIMAFGLKGKDSEDKTFCSEEMVTALRDNMILNGHDQWEFVNPAVVHPGYFRNLLIAAGAIPTLKGVI